jgi:membrane protein
VPQESLSLIEKAVVEVTDVRQGNLLSFSLILTLWAATGGIKAVMHCLNKAYDEREKRGFIKIQLLSIFFTLGLVVVLISTITLLVFGNIIGDYLSCCYQFSEAVRWLWNIIRYIIMVVVMIIIFAVIYHYTPSRRLTFKEVIPGALFSTAGWIIISIGFSYYVDNFANYSRLYGGIAAIFILMAWIYLSSMILLIGGEINATLALDRRINN